MIRRLVTSLTLIVGAFAFQIGTAAPAHALVSCINANDDSYDTPFNTPIDITEVQLLANDNTGLCDFGHDDLMVNDWTDPSNGTLTHSGNTFTYTPNDGFVGTDTFTYQACIDVSDFGKIGASETTEETGEGKICDWATVSIDPQTQVTTTVTVLDTVVTNSTTTATVLAAQLAATGADTSATLPIGGLLTGTGALFIGGSAIARRRLRGKYKKA